MKIRTLILVSSILVTNFVYSQSNYVFAGQIEGMNYYNIEPDIILNTHSTSYTQYYVDINNDIQTDITFGAYSLWNSNMHYSELKCWVYDQSLYNINLQNSNGSFIVTPFELNDTISMSSGYDLDVIGYFAHYPANFVGWVGMGPKYLGIRIGNNSLFRYGWFRVEAIQIDYDKFHLILYDYAIQQETVGVEEKLFIKQVFPNPTTGAIIIDCFGVDNYVYSLFQINGKLIMRGEFDKDDNILSLQDLETGVYFLTIENQKGQSSRHKILKK